MTDRALKADLFTRAQQPAQVTMSKADSEVSTRQSEILAMFASVPLDKVQSKMMELLDAKRTVSMGRDREPVEEPDSAIQLKVWQTIVEQQAGSAPNRKPVEPVKADKAGSPEPGQLLGSQGKRGKSPTTP